MNFAGKISIFFVVFCLFSCSKSDRSLEIIENFMQARLDGQTAKAYAMIDKKSRTEFSEKDFENYCFVYKPSEFEIAAGQNGYIEVSYTFYDKKFKKGNNELYTFYMTKNIERLKISDNKIVFPHIGFVHLRKAIEEKNIKEAKYFSDVMLKIDPTNPDVLETAEKMGLTE